MHGKLYSKKEWNSIVSSVLDALVARDDVESATRVSSGRIFVKRRDGRAYKVQIEEKRD